MRPYFRRPMHSTSGAIRTRTSALAAAARISVSAGTWRCLSCGCCFGCWLSGCRISRLTARSPGCDRTSSTASSTCRSVSADDQSGSVDLGKRPGELRRVEPGVGAVSGQQFVVGALLDDLPVLHYQDDVSVADRGQPVRDDEAGPALAQRVHRTLDQHFGPGVDRASRLVQDQDGWPGEERARDRDQLPLPHADVGTFFINDRFITIWQGLNKSIYVCRLRRGLDLLTGRRVRPVADVLRDRAAEEPGVLKHH